MYGRNLIVNVFQIALCLHNLAANIFCTILDQVWWTCRPGMVNLWYGMSVQSGIQANSYGTKSAVQNGKCENHLWIKSLGIFNLDDILCLGVYADVWFTPTRGRKIWKKWSLVTVHLGWTHPLISAQKKLLHLKNVLPANYEKLQI